MPNYKQILYSIEVHSVEGIQNYFREGGDPNEMHDDIPLFTTLVEMYTRTPRFKECVASPAIIVETSSLYRNTYTPLSGATLLHFCAEYNSINCGRLLIRTGADVNAKAELDEYGFGGHTPIFHTVNQNSNHSMDMLNLLLEYSADLIITVKGLIWGNGYEWETWIPSVNPISYAMMGLLPQMHRKEETIALIVFLLTRKAYGIDYKPANVPCAYLAH